MGFASSWLDKRAVFPEFIHEKPAEDTAVIVVIPAFNEPSLLPLLGSLQNCRRPSYSIEVIIVVNAPHGASPDVISVNDNSLAEIQAWNQGTRDLFFRIYTVKPDTSAFSDWGVGLARKTGMDEAVRRFDIIGDPEGIIACLDADCRVRDDYFIALYEDFYKRKGRNACSVYFEHPLSGSEFQEEVYRYIASYELHLRYFVRAIAYTGYPFAFHTVGSSMGVKALQYIRSGGMNRRQGGEDFYFIQKLIFAGGFFNLVSTVVYPSPRSSDRVPFGTGAAISSMLQGKMDSFLSYDFSAFSDIRIFFAMIDRIRSAGEKETRAFFSDLPVSLRMFIGEEEWIARTGEIRSNTTTPGSFAKRFFTWFNMFRIIKYLNWMHKGVLEKKPVEEPASRLLALQGVAVNSNDIFGLLEEFRRLDRQS